MRILILTVSDSVATGKFLDRSGPAVLARCQELGWEIVASANLPDDRDAIAAFLKNAADTNQCDLLLTTGGTGVGPRDVTPEATLSVAERNIPGFAEQMRAIGQSRRRRRFARRDRGAVASRRGCAARRPPRVVSILEIAPAFALVGLLPPC
jgi:molybdenum cofactor synthesis domain-containing protein